MAQKKRVTSPPRPGAGTGAPTSARPPTPTQPADRGEQRILARCRGRLADEHRAAIGQLLADGDRVGAATLDRASRAGCGADLTDLIEGVPADGAEYALACPRCGMAHTARRTPPDPVAG